MYVQKRVLDLGHMAIESHLLKRKVLQRLALLNDGMTTRCS